MIPFIIQTHLSPVKDFMRLIYYIITMLSPVILALKMLLGLHSIFRCFRITNNATASVPKELQHIFPSHFARVSHQNS